MAPDRYSVDRVKDILSQALDVPEGEAREEFLVRACGDDDPLRKEVRNLIAACEASSDFLSHDASGGPLMDFPDLIGSMIGCYRLIERIGEGGFGDIYRAEQTESLHREVALKVIKLGMDTKNVIARFEVERQALARMNHPGIAQVYDAGATESGRPYFVMELIDGIPIIDYCNRHHLPIPDRIRLFRQVCDAVEHAHQKGILHRDLKPSNILVGEENGKPIPKIIDFGVAKSLEGRLTEQTLATLQELLIGTPMYMSPEQLNRDTSDIDARTDIYSLGIILYELVAGTTPLEHKEPSSLTMAGMRQALGDLDLPRPSKRFHTMGKETTTIAHDRQIKPPTLERLLRGDLDWVVMKAIEKERDRRYVEVDALAQDLERYLNNKPVSAGPPSLAYRVKKFLRRHRSATAAFVYVGLTIIIGCGIMVYNFSNTSMKPKSLIEQRGWKLEKFCNMKGKWANDFAIRPDGSIVFTTGWYDSNRHRLYIARKGGILLDRDKIAEGKTFDTPIGVVELPDGIYVAVNRHSAGQSEILKIPPDGGNPTVLCGLPIMDPYGMVVAPETFDGPNVDPGDLLVFDNGWGDKFVGVIWAISRKTGEARPLIQGTPWNEGFFNGGFGPDGKLYAVLNDNGRPTMGACMLRVTPDGESEILLDKFNFSEVPRDAHMVNGVAVHPITGEVFFACRNNTFAFFPGKTKPRLVVTKGWKLKWAMDGSRLYFTHQGALWILSGPGIESQPISADVVPPVEKAAPLIEKYEWELERFCILDKIGANHIAFRPDGSLLFTSGWWHYAGKRGLHIARKGENWSEDNSLAKEHVSGCPTGVVELPDAIYLVLNRRPWGKILKLSPDGVDCKILCSAPIKDPHRMLVAPETFAGPNVDPGNLLVFDNGTMDGKRGAIWAVSRQTGIIQPLIRGNPLDEGFLNGSFGPDGTLYAGLSDDSKNGATILRISPNGEAEVVVDKFYFSRIENEQHPIQGIAVHPVTGEIFFSCRNKTFAFTPGKTQPCLVAAVGRAALWTPDGSRLFLADFGAIWTLTDPGIVIPPTVVE